MLLKAPIILSAFFVAVTDVLNEAIDAGSRVGTLGGQALLGLFLIILFIVIYQQEKRRTVERAARDAEQTARFNTVVTHHDQAVAGFNLERSAFTTTLIDLNGKSVRAMEGMTAAMDSLEQTLEYLVGKPSGQRGNIRKTKQPRK